MKKILLFSLLSLVILGCSNDDANVTIMGKWKLIEIYSDPGDGSGDFKVVDSNKIIELFSDGTYKSNGTLCTITFLSDNPTTGTFSKEDLIIKPDGCENQVSGLPYEIKGKIMIVTHFCIEGCAEMYVKIE